MSGKPLGTKKLLGMMLERLLASKPGGSRNSKW
jgi:hypothetical protein